MIKATNNIDHIKKMFQIIIVMLYRDITTERTVVPYYIYQDVCVLRLRNLIMCMR